MPTQQRKIVFILGAGASLGAGAYTLVQRGAHFPIPTQATFWGTLLRFCRTSQNRRDIESFLFRYFLGYARAPARSGPAERREALRGIDVEEVFTFLSERSRAPSTPPALKGYASRIWTIMIGELASTFSRFGPNARTRRTYRQLCENYLRKRDTVVSFNYDTVFEESLPGFCQWHYEGVSLAYRSMGVLKPHGSINWEDTDPIDVTDEPLRPLVVAPTHLKFVQSAPQPGETAGYLDHSPGIKKVWAIMEREMREAKALVFIGYSFPVADLYFSSVLRSVLADRDGTPGVAIVNPDAVAIRDRLKNRFALQRIVIHYDLQTFAMGNRKQLLDQLAQEQE